MSEPPVAATLEATAYAIGQLSAMLVDHPWAVGWRRNSAVDAAVGWIESDGEVADHGQVLARLAGHPHRGVWDGGGVAAAASWTILATQPAQTDLLPWRGDLVRPEDRVAVRAARNRMAYTRGQTPLDAALRALRRALADSVPGPAARIAFFERLHAVGMTPLPVPALAPRHLHCRAGQGESTTITVDEMSLRQEMISTAAAAVSSFNAWCATLKRLHDRLGARRRSSRLPEALDLLAAAGALHPAHLAVVLGVSTRGASTMLDDLVAAGAAVEITDRPYHRIFAPATENGTELRAEAAAWRESSEHAHRLARARERRKSPDVMAAAPTGTDALAAVLEEIDALNAELEPMLARYASYSEKA